MPAVFCVNNAAEHCNNSNYPEGYRTINIEPLGIHIYIGSNDVLRANAGVVMVHASSAGVKRINIPWQTPVREVVSGRIFNNAGKIELPMKFGQTAIFIPASR